MFLMAWKAQVCFGAKLFVAEQMFKMAEGEKMSAILRVTMPT